MFRMQDPESQPNEAPREDPPPDAIPSVDEPGREIPEVDPRRRDAPDPVREPGRQPDDPNGTDLAFSQGGGTDGQKN